jgi:hypothetical protein
MSLPSIAGFIYKGEVVETAFINCGWSVDSSHSHIRTMMDDIHDTLPLHSFHWDAVYLYEQFYSYDHIKSIVIDDGPIIPNGCFVPVDIRTKYVKSIYAMNRAKHGAMDQNVLH